MSSRKIGTAIDISGLSLDRIEETEERFSIGCMTSLRDLELHERLSRYTCGAMKEALCHIVGVQFRNLATVGGSIFGRYGFSDVLTMFSVMDSYVELYKGGTVPIGEFADMKPDNDILVSITVNKHPARMVYKSVRNSSTDFPVLTCAGSVIGEKIKIAVGARPGRAVILEDETEILGKEPSNWTEERINSFGRYAREHIRTGNNMRGSAEYRAHLMETLVKRVCRELGGNMA